MALQRNPHMKLDEQRIWRWCPSGHVRNDQQRRPLGGVVVPESDVAPSAIELHPILGFACLRG